MYKNVQISNDKTEATFFSGDWKNPTLSKTMSKSDVLSALEIGHNVSKRFVDLLRYAAKKMI